MWAFIESASHKRYLFRCTECHSELRIARDKAQDVADMECRTCRQNAERREADSRVKLAQIRDAERARLGRAEAKAEWNQAPDPNILAAISRGVLPKPHSMTRGGQPLWDADGLLSLVKSLKPYVGHKPEL